MPESSSLRRMAPWPADRPSRAYNIHQNEIYESGIERFCRLFAIRCRDHVVTSFFEHLHSNQAVHLIIIGEQNAQACGRFGNGSRRLMLVSASRDAAGVAGIGLYPGRSNT